MDIYLEELSKIVAYHDSFCDCRDCAMFYLLTEEEATNA